MLFKVFVLFLKGEKVSSLTSDWNLFILFVFFFIFGIKVVIFLNFLIRNKLYLEVCLNNMYNDCGYKIKKEKIFIILIYICYDLKNFKNI